MRLLDVRGGYLYEHRPDIMPYGMRSADELCLWSAYYDRKASEQAQVR